jgi:AcrR family transcriptional regulator
MDAVRRLLEQGTFHEASVEEIARVAGVARATLYQHFGSRLGLVEAICGSLSENPSMVAIQASPTVADPRQALMRVIRQGIRFWASEEALHRHLYGLAEIDESAAEFVERQTADRRSVVERIAERLIKADALRDGVSDAQAWATLLVLTSFHTFQELRTAGLSLEEIERYALAGAEDLIDGGWRPGGSAHGRTGSQPARDRRDDLAL